jgi:hypothetical protein
MKTRSQVYSEDLAHTDSKTWRHCTVFIIAQDLEAYIHKKEMKRESEAHLFDYAGIIPLMQTADDSDVLGMMIQ